MSGPLLDRIDLQVEVPRPEQSILNRDAPAGENSSAVRRRVMAARKIQLKRTGTANALLTTSGIRHHCRLGHGELELLREAAERLALSPRACHRVLKVARTIADLERQPDLQLVHLAEAISLRQIERQGPAA